jgi:tRNA nucleotidyltransferase (CCA-adding enzyme)
MDYPKNSNIPIDREEEKDLTNPEYQRRAILEQSPELLKPISDFAAKIYSSPHDPKFPDVQPRALLVGGFVRDALLGQHPKDADLEVYGVSPERLVELLTQMFPDKVDLVGQQFGILKVYANQGIEFDVSIPRRESKSGTGHKGFVVQSDPAMSIEEAGRRRDFTWNALAADPMTGEVFDYFNGISDLEKRSLRVTDPERFKDDPLRVMRALQFAARYNFTVEPESKKLMQEMVSQNQLAELPAERMTTEVEKLLLKGEKPSVGFELARELGIIEKHYPELHALIDTPQEPEWHPEGDVWIHTMMVVDSAAKIIRQESRGFTPQEKLEVMLGALCHDLGKPATTEVIDGKIRSLAHEEAGIEPTKALLSKFKFSEEVALAAEIIAAEHLKPGQHYREFAEKQNIDEKTYINILRRLIKRIDPVSWRVLVAASESDSRGRTIPGIDTAPYGPGEAMTKVIIENKLDVAAKTNLISGKDIFAVAERLGMKVSGGRKFGDCIKKIEEKRDNQEIDTKEEALAILEEMMREGFFQN